jgi:hypothetical protein
MRKLLALLLLSPLAFAEKNEMIPLSDYVANLTEKSGDSEMLYVMYRCAGLYGMMYGLMQNAPQEGAKQTLKDLDEANLTIITLAEAFYNKLTPEDERDFEDNLTRSVLPMADNYQREANKSWTNTGNYFNDYILEDAEMCKFVVEYVEKR